jgi:hypothetical protein
VLKVVKLGVDASHDHGSVLGLRLFEVHLN